MSKNSVCRAYLWNHTSYGCLCYTSVKWKYLQLFFAFFQNFYFCVTRRVKVKKWPKMTTNTVRCALYLRNHTPYDLWSSLMVHRRKGIISPFFFLHFFQMLIFGVNSGVKGQKRPKMTKNYICHTPYFRKHISYDHDFWYTNVKWWHFQNFLPPKR